MQICAYFYSQLTASFIFQFHNWIKICLFFSVNFHLKICWDLFTTNVQKSETLVNYPVWFTQQSLNIYTCTIIFIPIKNFFCQIYRVGLYYSELHKISILLLLKKTAVIVLKNTNFNFQFLLTLSAAQQKFIKITKV